MRRAWSIRQKLLLGFAVPVALLFTTFAWVALNATRRDLDTELGLRLTSVAAAAATQLRGKYLVELGPGNENDRGYLSAQKKMQAIEVETGVELFIVDAQYALRADARGTPIGTRLAVEELNAHELQAVFAQGARVASMSFQGRDGVWYKTGYAPLRASETEAEIVLALGARAPARYFARLDELRRQLLWWGAALLVSVLVATWASTVLLLRNVKRLAAAAEVMKQGDLEQPVPQSGHDEIGVLGETLEAMRRHLAQRDVERQAMLAGIAHEVRNPLAGMQLYVDILRDELPAGDANQAHVEKIGKELIYLERVVADFLSFARKPSLLFEPVAAVELVRELAPLGATREHAVEVAVTPSDEGGDAVVRADRNALRGALLNLVNNAVQAATPGSVVTITVSADRAWVHLAVRNYGPMIAPEVAARVFEPFFTTREKGTGLGLALVQQCAHAHGGRVALRREGEQTVFELTLPRFRGLR